jgi:uncharacterized repeat protein (TIGR03943 family)
VSRRSEGLLLVLAGLVAFRLVVIGTYDQYVRTGMRLPLVVASAVLVAIGVVTTVRGALAEDRVAAGEAPEHESHDHAPLVGWLLIAPIGVLLAIAPASLGADAAARQPAYTSSIQSSAFPALPEPRDGAVDVRLAEFVDRALWDAERSLDGTSVRLTGFVVHDDRVEGGFLLTRFQIACCAADAVPVEVAVPDPPSDHPDDQWVEVVGRLVPPVEATGSGALPLVGIDAEEVVAIPEPETPYE